MKHAKLGFVSLMLVLLLAGCTQQGGTNNYTQPGAQGARVVMLAADKSADLGSITSIQVTINSIQVHSATQGWVTVSSNPETIDLMLLKASGKQSLLADINLQNGTYDQARLEISNVVVTDAQGSHQAKLPSGDLRIVGDFDANQNSTAVAIFDFHADKSLHLTGNGQYILAPAVHFQTRENANVDDNNQQNVIVNSGEVKTDKEVGMDEKGNVDVGLGIPTDATISIDDSGNVHLGEVLSVNGSTKGSVVVVVKDKAINMSAVSSINITIDSVMAQAADGSWATISSTPHTYDLLALNSGGKAIVLADTQLNKGTYNKIKMEVSSVIVTDAQGSHQAKLPSGDLMIEGPLVVNGNTTSAVTFDFLASESLHVTGKGEYIMAPVINAETRENATVNVNENNEANVQNGMVDSRSKEGMDEKGDFGIGIEIPKDAEISIDEGGMIRIGILANGNSQSNNSAIVHVRID